MLKQTVGRKPLEKQKKLRSFGMKEETLVMLEELKTQVFVYESLNEIVNNAIQLLYNETVKEKDGGK